MGPATRRFSAIAQSAPRTSSTEVPEPWAFITRTSSNVAPGAVPYSVPAARDAVSVPCPWASPLLFALLVNAS